MFDVTAEDIAKLDDIDLRELVGRLCEADLVCRGFSPAFSTWGGNQTAADGGVDVRVSLPPEIPIDGFIPRTSTGFQVKKSDMPRAALLAEMRPSGKIRPVIAELAEEGGAYIVVSSHGSTSDSVLRGRREALREAVSDVPNAHRLLTDFFDRNRLASWVRLHPGIAVWVREKVGRALVGWRPYGAWSTGAENADAEYLIDEKLRVNFGKGSTEVGRSIAEAIDELRDILSHPQATVRLVGLSGVGKTRLVQALFDMRIGSRPLSPSLAVYSNLSDNPDPQPIGLVSDLIAIRQRAVLIVDNCPPDLHRRLTDLCISSESTVSLLTVEYDVRDDQPERTRVITLDTSSPELIEELVANRSPHLSQVDARTIANLSGGNARIALAIAGTVEATETIVGLSDENIFERLFGQRHDSDTALLAAAHACALVYSFQGEAFEGEAAELPRLAALAGQTPLEIYRHIGEMLRRDLVQKRSVWRAVLPHALANKLAARALNDIPYDLIDKQLVSGGTARLMRSFSRRLSFLPDHPMAIAIVEKWLGADGLLGDISTLNELGRAMFENIAPVSPEAALKALERVKLQDFKVAVDIGARHQLLIRSLAYDAKLFERSVSLLAVSATESQNDRVAKEVSDTFCSLFTVYLSGTHATVDQRIGIVEPLLRSTKLREQSLGLRALDQMLEAGHFSVGYRFEFSTRSRDYGYRPKSIDEQKQWFAVVLNLIRKLSTEGIAREELRDLLARNFRSLWSSAHMYAELESLSKELADGGFWRDGWVSCRQTMRFDRERSTPENLLRLAALETYLRPSNARDRIRAVVLGNRSAGLDLEDIDLEADISIELERQENIAHALGSSLAANTTLLDELLPEFLKGGNRVFAFGRGLAVESEDHEDIWGRFVSALRGISPEHRNIQIMRGFLFELSNLHSNLAQIFLDEALREPVLQALFPELQAAVTVDERGVERLKLAVQDAHAPMWMYRNLGLGRTIDDVSGRSLKELILLIAGQNEGFDTALEILYMRFRGADAAKRAYEPELLETGRELANRVRFRKSDNRGEYFLANIVRICLACKSGSMAASEIADRLRQAVAAYEAYAYEHDELLKALLLVQPFAVLDALFKGEDKDHEAGVQVFDYLHGHRTNPADVITPEDLVSWCNQDPKVRYNLAASIVTLNRKVEKGEPERWSEQANALLENASDRRRVLELFVQRFRPSSWSGSRAAIIEANTRLLDDLRGEIGAELKSFAAVAQQQLRQEIEQEKQWETRRDSARDERFE